MLNHKYGNIMEYLDLCWMREVGYMSTKPHFANSWVRKPLKYTALSVRDAFRISSTWSLSKGLCFQVRNSWHSLFFCWRLSNSVALLWAPPSGLGWIACIRCKASCTEPRCLYRDGLVRIHVSFHPYIYTYIHTVPWKVFCPLLVFVFCFFAYLSGLNDSDHQTHFNITQR